MAKQREFPITIKAGGTAIKIYQSPLRVPAVDAASSESRTYDSFLVA
jgi:hypothetical protein